MSKTAPAYPPSPYSSPLGKANPESHTLSVLVDNEPGVLARVVGLFSARSFNIESLTVAEVAHETHQSRITIVTSGTPEVIEQVRHQLERLVPVHSVTDLTLSVRAVASRPDRPCVGGCRRRSRSCAPRSGASGPYRETPRIRGCWGTGVSVTRWSPKPQRQVRLLGPPLRCRPDPRGLRWMRPVGARRERASGGYGRLKRFLAAATAARVSQPARWSLTRPIACMNA